MLSKIIGTLVSIIIFVLMYYAYISPILNQAVIDNPELKFYVDVMPWFVWLMVIIIIITTFISLNNEISDGYLEDDDQEEPEEIEKPEKPHKQTYLEYVKERLEAQRLIRNS